jgi:hypothetical protein
MGYQYESRFAFDASIASTMKVDGDGLDDPLIRLLGTSAATHVRIQRPLDVENRRAVDGLERAHPHAPAIDGRASMSPDLHRLASDVTYGFPIGPHRVFGLRTEGRPHDSNDER